MFYAFITYFTTDSSIDFNSTMQVCVIPAGSNSSTVNITVIDDDLVEGDEMFIMRMHAPASLAMGAITEATGIIIDTTGMYVCKSQFYINT